MNLIRLIVLGLLIYFGYRLFKSWGGSFLQSRGRSGPDEASNNTELIQDPQCGTYFLRQTGVEARIGGKTVHFCSDQCRNAYITRHGGSS